MKGDAKYRNFGGLGYVGVVEGRGLLEIAPFDIVHTSSY